MKQIIEFYGTKEPLEYEAETFKEAIQLAIKDGKDLSYSILCNQDLSELDLSDGVFHHADFANSFLANSNINNGDYSNCNFQGSYIISCNGQKSNFRSANFCGADLSNSSFNYSDFEFSKLDRTTNRLDANFNQAKVFNSDFDAPERNAKTPSTALEKLDQFFKEYQKPFVYHCLKNIIVFCLFIQKANEKRLAKKLNKLTQQQTKIEKKLGVCSSKINNYSAINQQVNQKLASIDYDMELAESTLRSKAKYLDWDKVCETQKLSEEFMRDYRHFVNFNTISKTQDLNESFIEEFADKLNWESLLKYQKNLSKDFILSHSSVANISVEKYNKLAEQHQDISDISTKTQTIGFLSSQVEQHSIEQISSKEDESHVISMVR